VAEKIKSNRNCHNHGKASDPVSAWADAAAFSMAAFRVPGEKVGTMCGQVRGRTKDECWRNYIDDKRTSGGVLLDVIPSNKQEA